MVNDHDDEKLYSDSACIGNTITDRHMRWDYIYMQLHVHVVTIFYMQLMTLNYQMNLHPSNLVGQALSATHAIIEIPYQYKQLQAVLITGYMKNDAHMC